MTRIFTLDIPDNKEQVRAALKAQGELEITGPSEVDPALIAFQTLLQVQAPWNVIVPFAVTLAIEIGKTASAPRILRDFQRVLSLVKSVAVIRHQHRGAMTKGG